MLQWWEAKERDEETRHAATQMTYYFAFLKRGPKWTAESTPETASLQAAHMAHIQAMAATGKLVIAGPFAKAPPYSGVVVFKTVSLEEAKSMARS